MSRFHRSDLAWRTSQTIKGLHQEGAVIRDRMASERLDSGQFESMAVREVELTSQAEILTLCADISALLDDPVLG